MTATVIATDGRTARRERGRMATVDAMIDLVLDGGQPSPELLVQRAGISVATLFRYFDTLDELRRATMTRYLERFADLFELPACGAGALDERIDALVGARSRLYAATEPMARLTRARAPDVPEVAEELHRIRGVLADQVRRHFAAELSASTPARREDLVAAVCVLTSFEAWVQLRDDHGRSPAQLRRTWTTTLHRLLTEPGPS